MTIVAILLLAAALVILVGRWRRTAPGRNVDADRRRDDGIVILPIDMPTTGDGLTLGDDAFTPGGGDFGGAGSSGSWDSSDSSSGSSSDGGGGD